jgi:hypothetical protein
VSERYIVKVSESTVVIYDRVDNEVIASSKYRTADEMNSLIDTANERASELNAMDESNEESAFTAQKGGDHYKKYGDYQPWQVFEKWLTPEELKGFMKGTVIAYLAREADKGGRLDIEKAKHTLELYLELTGGSDE